MICRNDEIEQPVWFRDFDAFCEAVAAIGRDDINREALEDIFTTPRIVEGRGWSDGTWKMWLRSILPPFECDTAKEFPGEYLPGMGSVTQHIHTPSVMRAHRARTEGQRTKLGHTNGG